MMLIVFSGHILKNKNWTHGLSVNGINNKRFKRRYMQGIYNWIIRKVKHIFEMNNSLHNSHKILSCPSTQHKFPPVIDPCTLSLGRYLCQFTSAGCNDIDDRKSSWRTCITAGNILGETCPLSAHQFFSNLLSPLSSRYSDIQ